MADIIDPTLIAPVGTHLLVATFEGASQTDSGLDIDQGSGNTFPVCGTVLAVGPQSQYEKDQQVMFRRYSLDELKISSGGVEQTVYLLEDEDILATYGGDLTPPQNPRSQIQKKKENAGIIPKETDNAIQETTG